MADRIVQAYPLQSMGSDVVTISMPRMAQIVHFSPHGGNPTIWAIVDLDEPTELRRFKMVLTGFTIPDDGIYIGSAMMMKGDSQFQMHFFEVPIPEVDNERWSRR